MSARGPLDTRFGLPHSKVSAVLFPEALWWNASVLPSMPEPLVVRAGSVHDPGFPKGHFV